VAGAFTGAVGSREGLVAGAAGGTLFLDEIDALPPSAQVKLLRLLQENEYRPLGSPGIRKADLRVIAASNADLREAMQQGRFRQDLFYRLGVLSVRLPPLRDRADDVLLLAGHFARRFSERYQKTVTGLSTEARARLLAHEWPGNVRELENVIERAIILARRPLIEAPDIELHCESDPEGMTGFQQAKARVVRNFETDYLRRVLAMHNGNITQAARTAGKNRRAMFELVRKHHIQVRLFAAEQ
jgi:two-component system response regulator GlrR